MTSRWQSAWIFSCLLAPAPSLAIAEDGPPVVPSTRSELKQNLEDSKRNQPRLPLPPMSAADKEKMAKATWGSADWSVYNNGRMRKHYLPAELSQVSALRGDDPAMTLGQPFQTKLFWIISRGNNCTYCMGHQESKLSAAGLSDDQIASLDGDWLDHSAKDRAAFAFARKITFEPQSFGDADIAALKAFYTDAQVLEILNACGNFNAMNRWTGALRIPQEDHRVYLSPTAEKYRDSVSKQAPLDLAGRATGQVCAKPASRAALESRADVERALADCRTREPRLPLVDEAKARAILGGDLSSDPLPQWVRLLATFTKSGVSRIALHHASETQGELDSQLKAQIAWISARHDRAWYALGHAHQQLKALGQTDDAIFALDHPASPAFSPAQIAVFALAKKLTVDPALVEDADIAALRKHFPDKVVAEIVFQVTEAAYFDRLTEAAGLRLER